MVPLPRPLVELRKLVGKMPGFSERGAERFLEWWWQHAKEREDFHESWGKFIELKPCQKCFFFAADELCDFCRDKNRDLSKICIVSSPFTVSLIEKEAAYRGYYFVLGGDAAGIRNFKLIELVKRKIFFLKNRISKEKISEVIIATDFTSRGEATALFIQDVLKDAPAKISRLAQGLHAGDSIGYSDPVTLKKAFENREGI